MEIKSYSFEEMASFTPKRKLILLVEDASSEEGEEIYNQVKLTDIEFRKVCAVINKGKIGFTLNVFSDKFTIDEVD